MFTIYIRILEVLAMNLDGASVATITDMSGGLLTNQKTLSHLRDLKREGYVTHDDLHTMKWSITDKALEYCEIVVRKHDNVMKEQEAIVVQEIALKNGIAPSQDAITEVSETTQVPSGLEGSVSFELMSDVTIAEHIQIMESLSVVKVTKAVLVDGIVTLTYQPIEAVNNEPECDECFECGACGNVHESWCPYNEP